MRETEADREREFFAEWADDLAVLSHLLDDILVSALAGGGASPEFLGSLIGDALTRVEELHADELHGALKYLDKGLYLFRKNPHADLFDIAFPGPAAGRS